MNLRTLCVVLPAAVACGCTTLPLAEGWGRARDAAVAAARDPWVWAPLAGAAVLQVGNADHRISSWAVRETPLFGSNAHAGSASDTLRSVAVVADATVVLLEPRAVQSTSWLEDKALNLGEDLAAATVAIGTAHVLKSETGRVRPLGQDSESFPSGHVTIAAAYDRLAADRLARFDEDRPLTRGLVYGLDAVTVATAWARIEAGAHYPSDTLAGMAIGAFSAKFFALALRDGTPTRVTLSVAPQRGGLALGWSLAY
jgi:hypothetical protein